MKLSLVIPAYNEEGYIGECLDAALAAGKGRFFEVIVIDNASSDRTGEIARARSGVRVVREEKKGLTQARARGLAEATGEIVAYIDADTRMGDGWYEKVDAAFADSKITSFSGPYHYYDAPAVTRILMRMLWWFSSNLVYPSVGYMLLGGNFAARKSALVAMGGFDTSIDFYGEDTDIARRVSAYGKALWQHDFFILTSARRLNAEGLIRTNLVYALNFVWEVVFGKPYTRAYRDVRPTSSSGKIEARTLRATGACLLFLVVGLYGVPRVTDLRSALPLMIFYFALVFNTFFSVRLFGLVISPEDMFQQGIDLFIALFYLGLPFLFSNTLLFLYGVSVFFVVTAAKYAVLIDRVVHPKLLKKKLLANLLGAGGAGLSLGLALAGHSDLGAWLYSIGFLVANVIFFTISPLYRLDSTE